MKITSSSHVDNHSKKVPMFEGWMNEEFDMGLDVDREYEEPLDMDKVQELVNYVSNSTGLDLECTIHSGDYTNTGVSIDRYVDNGEYFEVTYASLDLPNQYIYQFNRQSASENYSELCRSRFWSEGYNFAQFVCYPFACTQQYYDKMSEFKDLYSY